MLTATERKDLAKAKAFLRRQAEIRAKMKKSSALGKLIRFKREALGLDQKVVARAMDFSNVFLGRIEFGKCDLPLRHVEKLASLLRLPKSRLLFAIKKDINKRFDKKLE